MPLPVGFFSGARGYARLGGPAIAEVVVLDPTGATAGPLTRCRVDTGSDLTVLPLLAATAVGITPSSSVTFTTVAGTPVTLPAERVLLEIEGVRVRRRVAFSSASFTPVVGFQDLLSAFEFGFDKSAWHFN